MKRKIIKENCNARSSVSAITYNRSLMPHIKYGLLLTLCLICMAKISRAQQQLQEGYITVTYDVDSTKIKKNLTKINDNVNITFSGDLIKADLNVSNPLSANNLIPLTIFKNLKNDQVNILINNLGFDGKIVLTGSDEEMTLFLQQFKDRIQYNELLLLQEMGQQISSYTPTGEKMNIDGYNAEKYTSSLSDGSIVSIWTTQDISLPASIDKYPIGNGLMLLQKPKVSGTLLKLNFEQKIGMQIKISRSKVDPAAMEVPKGSVTMALKDMINNPR